MDVDLFQNKAFEAPFMMKEAVISDCTFYRYELRRVWENGKPLLPVCMLNPSTADSSINDPTVLTLIHFGKLWGYGGLLIVNLYGFRSSSPAEMFSQGAAAVGPLNEKYTFAAVQYAKQNGGKLLAAWGNDGHDRATFFAERVTCVGVELICLGKTQSGAPKHPLARGKHRVPRDQMPMVWRAAVVTNPQNPAPHQRAMAWQDISTAPRDTEILVWNGRKRHVAHWDRIEGAWVSSYRTTTKRLDVLPAPTLWQPLPAEPTAIATEGPQP